MNYEQTQYGFVFGAAIVTRLFAIEEEQRVVIGIETPKHPGRRCVEIHVTKSGKVRIFDSRGEWKPAAELKKEGP